MINGYITLDLTKDNVYTQATACLNADKPILIYDGSKSFYASFIAIDNGTKTITVTAPNTTITITTAGVVTATDTTPHLYRVKFTDSDLEGFIDLPVNVGELEIGSSAEEITDDEKEVLNKLIGLNVKFPITSDDASWSSPNVEISTSSSSFIIIFSAVVNGSLKTGRYIFNVVDGVVDSLDSIVDDEFADGLTITTTQLF